MPTDARRSPGPPPIFDRDAVPSATPCWPPTHKNGLIVARMCRSGTVITYIHKNLTTFKTDILPNYQLDWCRMRACAQLANLVNLGNGVGRLVADAKCTA
jgi:hypothetical protein